MPLGFAEVLAVERCELWIARRAGAAASCASACTSIEWASVRYLVSWSEISVTCTCFPTLKVVTVFLSMIVRALLPLMALALAAAAAGCGGGGNHRAATTTTTTSTTAALKPCRLTTGQRRAVAQVHADIRRLRRIQAPLHKFSEMGTPAQERVTNKVLLDLGGAKLPINLRSSLLAEAKSAVGLCGLCFSGLESAEPVLAGRLGQARCG